MEVIVAFGIMVMGIVAVLILTSYNITASGYAEKRLIASNLAREALEVVRNERDSNWLAGNDWDNGLPHDINKTVYYKIVSLNKDRFASGILEYDLVDASEISTCGDDCKLYVQASTFSHDSDGTFSGFYRNVEIRDICAADLENPGNCVTRVGVTVIAKTMWRAPNGDMRIVAIEDRLFDWR